ncbi:hypothetical protein PsorP6_003611 [Peronosclerospora sorghi]|uniref:Uncharacterized protein n=1 Tax=Peronosclerospora sorghi TaxID=230839 RepID=A0ACC0VST4_9STRA|nr:hypothetical protein PsorP6_003611 [Peronosclerospora sorghi]
MQCKRDKHWQRKVVCFPVAMKTTLKENVLGETLKENQSKRKNCIHWKKKNINARKRNLLKITQKKKIPVKEMMKLFQEVDATNLKCEIVKIDVL